MKCGWLNLSCRVYIRLFFTVDSTVPRPTSDVTVVMFVSIQCIHVDPYQKRPVKTITFKTVKFRDAVS